MGLLAVALLILAHAFFVAGEFSIVAVDRAKVERLAEEGNRRAKSTLKAQRTLSFQLSGAQLGITVTSLLVGFLIEPTIGEALEPLMLDLGISEQSALAVSVAVALALATAVEMVVAELIPKNLAIAKPLEVAFAIAAPFRWCNALFRPVIQFLNASANTTVRLLGIEPQEELRSIRSLDELGLLINASREQGALPEDQFSLLSRSITFGGKTAADALVPRVAVTALHQDEPLTRLMATALETGHSRFPIFDKDLDDIVGVAHVKDVYDVSPEQRDATPVSQIAQEPLVVPESRDLGSLLVEMRRRRRQLAIVIDEYGGTAGILTLEDLLEEIVGEIEDEYDASRGVEVPAAGPTGVHVVSALMHHDEVRDATGFEMPDGDYETLAGFLLTLFDRIPENGDHVSYDGWEFKVTEMDGRRIAKVLLVKPSGDGGGS